MTYCPLLLTKVQTEVENNKNIKLSDIGTKFCGAMIKHPELKAKRLIIEAKGKKWWEENKSRYIDESKARNPNGKGGRKNKNDDSQKKFRQQELENITTFKEDKLKLLHEIKEFSERYDRINWWEIIDILTDTDNREFLKLIAKHVGKAGFKNVVDEKIKKLKSNNTIEDNT